MLNTAKPRSMGISITMVVSTLLQAPVSPALSPGAQPAVGATSLYDVGQMSSSSSALTVAYPPAPPAGPSRGSQREQVFPERPGERDCQYYMRTGDCKYGSICRFHHPRDRLSQGPHVSLSSLGLPLRPVCKFFQSLLQLLWFFPLSFYMKNDSWH